MSTLPERSKRPPTVQERMLAMLADGQAHTTQELHCCLYDELTPLLTVRVHISYLRRKIRPGQDLLHSRADDTYRLITFAKNHAT